MIVKLNFEDLDFLVLNNSKASLILKIIIFVNSINKA